MEHLKSKLEQEKPIAQQIQPLSDCNGTRTHNHVVRKRTLNHLAKLAILPKWLNVRLRSKWSWIRVPLQSLKFQIWSLFQARSYLTLRKLQSVDSL